MTGVSISARSGGLKKKEGKEGTPQKDGRVAKQMVATLKNGKANVEPEFIILAN